MEKLYTRKEAAEVLGVSLCTLDQARSDGSITYIQYVNNGSVFFTKEALEEFVARSTHRARPVENRQTYRRVRRR